MTYPIKNILSFSLLLVTGILLSGCSLAPTKTIEPTKEIDPAFQSKATPGSIWKSEDGGKTFEPRITVDEKTKITKADILALSFLERNPEQPNPSTAPKVFAGTIDSGIFESSNGGETWDHIIFPPKKIYSFLVDRSDSKRMFATGVIAERGKVFRTADGGESWQDMYTEPGLKTVVVSLAQHFRDTNVIFAGTSAGTVVKSTDKGDTWKNVGQTIDGPVTEITFDAGRPKTVYALAFEKKIWYSDNGGELWIDWETVKRDEHTACVEKNRARQLTAGNDSCAKIIDQKRAQPSGIISLVADPRVSGRLLAGTKTGLFESRDYGKYWDELNIIESARNFPLRAIAISHANPQEIVFVAGRALYKSVNGGETWAVVQLNIDRDVSVLQYDPFDASILYFGLRKY